MKALSQINHPASRDSIGKLPDSEGCFKRACDLPVTPDMRNIYMDEQRLLLNSVHRLAGAELGLVDGWEVPLHYGNSAEEELSLSEGLALVDRSNQGCVSVTGRDRAAFLQGLLSNDVAKLTAGGACQAALLTPKGRVRWIVGVIGRTDELLLTTPPGESGPLVKLLDSYLIMEQVELRDVSSEYGTLNLAGPRCWELAAQISPAVAALGETAAFSRTEELEAGDHRVIWVASNRAGVEGLECWLPRDAIEGYWNSLTALGGPLGLSPSGYSAVEVSRVGAGFAKPGVDVTEEVLLPEIPFEHLVSWTKGCYMGQEPVARVHYRGRVTRALTAFKLTGHGQAAEHRLVSDGKDVGGLTSVVKSQRTGEVMALGFVRQKYREPGTRLMIRSAAGEEGAAVVVPARLIPLSGTESGVEGE